MNILVVDDEYGVRTALSSLIIRAKHQVVAAVDGSEALLFVRQAKTPFDLVITDHVMPGMYGSEFVRQLRIICLRVRIIVFSAHISPDDERRYRDLDVKLMLIKPFGFHEIIKILDGLANLSAQAQMFWLLSETTV